MKHPSQTWASAIITAALFSFTIGASAAEECESWVKIRAYGDTSSEALYPVEQKVPHHTTNRLNLYITHGSDLGGLSIINDERKIPFSISHSHAKGKWVHFKYADMTSKTISAVMHPEGDGAACSDTFTVPLNFKPLDG